jgi:hypothetical protein
VTRRFRGFFKKLQFFAQFRSLLIAMVLNGSNGDSLLVDRELTNSLLKNWNYRDRYAIGVAQSKRNDNPATLKVA